MPTKIESNLSHEQFEEFCQKLLKLPGKERTLAGIQKLAEGYGITISHEAARSFKKGPFARHLEKLNRSRETREALVAAAGAGVHPLDALEEAMVIELQDHLTESQTVDVKFVIGQLVKLRTALTMREDTRRKDETEKRKARETEAKLKLADEQLAKLREQNAKLVADREAREAALQAKAAAAGAALNKPKASPDEIRTQTVALIDEIMGIKPKAPATAAKKA